MSIYKKKKTPCLCRVSFRQVKCFFFTKADFRTAYAAPMPKAISEPNAAKQKIIKSTAMLMYLRMGLDCYF